MATMTVYDQYPDVIETDFEGGMYVPRMSGLSWLDTLFGARQKSVLANMFNPTALAIANVASGGSVVRDIQSNPALAALATKGWGDYNKAVESLKRSRSLQKGVGAAAGIVGAAFAAPVVAGAIGATGTSTAASAATTGAAAGVAEAGGGLLAQAGSLIGDVLGGGGLLGKLLGAPKVAEQLPMDLPGVFPGIDAGTVPQVQEVPVPVPVSTGGDAGGYSMPGYGITEANMTTSPPAPTRSPALKYAMWGGGLTGTGLLLYGGYRLMRKPEAKGKKGKKGK